MRINRVSPVLATIGLLLVLPLQLARAAPTAEGLPSPSYLVAMDGHLYWIDIESKEIMHLSPDAAKPETLAVAPTKPLQLVAQGEFLYWCGSDRDGSGVYRMRRTAQAVPERLAEGQGVRHFFVSGDTIYFADSVSGTINTVPTSGGAVTIVYGGLKNPSNVAVAGGHIFWSVEGTAGAIFRAKLGTQKVSQIARAGMVDTFAADDSYLYWTDSIEGTVSRLKLSSGKPEVLARNPKTTPRPLAIGGDLVVWGATGELWKYSTTNHKKSMLATTQKKIGGVAIVGDTLCYTMFTWTLGEGSLSCTSKSAPQK